MNRRLFLTTACSAICAASTSFGTTLLLPINSKVDLWETKVDTFLQMTSNYGFTTKQTNAVFGYIFSDSTNQELRAKLLNLCGVEAIVQRVDLVSCVHTWLCGGAGSDISLQLRELHRLRTIKKLPVSGQKPEQSLGVLLQSGKLTDLMLAAHFCNTTPLLFADHRTLKQDVAVSTF